MSSPEQTPGPVGASLPRLIREAHDQANQERGVTLPPLAPVSNDGRSNTEPPSNISSHPAADVRCRTAPPPTTARGKATSGAARSRKSSSTTAVAAGTPWVISCKPCNTSSSECLSTGKARATACVRCSASKIRCTGGKESIPPDNGSLTSAMTAGIGHVPQDDDAPAPGPSMLVRETPAVDSALGETLGVDETPGIDTTSGVDKTPSIDQVLAINTPLADNQGSHKSSTLKLPVLKDRASDLLYHTPTAETNTSDEQHSPTDISSEPATTSSRTEARTPAHRGGKSANKTRSGAVRIVKAPRTSTKEITLVSPAVPGEYGGR